MRRLSHPPEGTGTGGGSACVRVAVEASTRAWTAGGVAGTRCRASRVLCQLPPVPAPSRLSASSPVKCGTSVKSKHSVGEGCKGTREGVPNPTGAHYHPHPTYSAASSLPLKRYPRFPRNYPRGPGDKHRFVLTNPNEPFSTYLCFYII